MTNYVSTNFDIDEAEEKVTNTYMFDNCHQNTLVGMYMSKYYPRLCKYLHVGMEISGMDQQLKWE